MSVALYTFETAHGVEDTFATLDQEEARDYARRYGLRCIANMYELARSETVWDFTQKGADHAETEAAPGVSRHGG